MAPVGETPASGSSHGVSRDGYPVRSMPQLAPEKPSFLQPAFDTTPADLPGPVAPGANKPADAVEKPLERPMTPMTQPPCSRPASASGERSLALDQGFLKISEVESTMRLNAALEQDNIALEAQIAQLLRVNLQLRNNIGSLEEMLGLGAAEGDDGRPEASTTDD
mmetsp:Transcript_139721/g.243286  ORF Transcript_139721/g.243286 Transcript_139721/m.243286 type:complete len:165 (+) Transcript_139721:69-563(+)